MPVQAASHKSRKDRPSKQASQRRASSKKRPEDSTHLSPTQQPDEKAQPPSSENSDKTVQEQAAAAQGGAPGSDERREKAAGSDAGSPSTKKSTQYYRKQARKQGIKFQGRPDGDLKAMRCFVSGMGRVLNGCLRQGWVQGTGERCSGCTLTVVPPLHAGV
jgi:hypothetical protein